MNQKAWAPRLSLALSMIIFGTIGIFRTYIPLPSGLLAAARGLVGALFLLLLVYIRGGRLDRRAIRANAGILVISGGLIGFNWILLFEAYRYTDVATATLCYYMAPVFVILASPLVLRERLTLRRALCAAVALIGMLPVSGVLGAGKAQAGELRGVLLGLGAALLYATVMLLNQKLKNIGAYDKTVVQLACAGVALLPYVLLVEDVGTVRTLDATGIWMTVLVCVVHTGVAYALYFGSMAHLSAQTVALLAYIDPVVAVVLSAAVLRQGMSSESIVGAILILGATVWSECPVRKRKKDKTKERL